MFTGFNLTTQHDFANFEEIGREVFRANRRTVKHKLDGFLLNDGSIDGGDLQEDWFPQFDVDVFISHSHKDETTAIGLAGFLYHKFGITSFVDSCVWGYAGDLLREIDNEFCKTEDEYYSYRKRNYSTSHVHMMLSTALSMMIDKTECVLFLNSPRSISASEVIDSTHSPWIYHELAMTRLIARKSLGHYRHPDIFKTMQKSLASDKALQILYPAPLDHLHPIEDVDLLLWAVRNNESKLDYPLDHLYSLAGIL